MRRIAGFIFISAIFEQVISYEYTNVSTLSDAASQQLPEFRRIHGVPIGVLTKLSGEPIDLRDTVTLNTETLQNREHFRLTTHLTRERIPEHVVHAKGTGAYGYFEVTHDVSAYTKADVFNGIGKRTPVKGKFSTARQSSGGSDVTRDIRAVSLKMYTKEGNLDLITFNIPVFIYRDPIDFARNNRAFRRNPRTRVFDQTSKWDFMTTKPESIYSFLWAMSDHGIPDGYRKANYFPLHTYEIYNRHGESFFVKFNFRTEIGLYNLTDAQAMAIGAEDSDYFDRDLYNALAAKDYPAWRLDMDILTKDQLTKVDYDPFDTVRLWKRGTYKTVPIGRLVINRNVDNHFKDIELGGLSPDNLVPGIIGPHDALFKGRKLLYPDAQNYRLGANFDNINTNAPLNKMTYSRDGVSPVLDNMKDVPSYFPNSFNGPMPYVDEARPKTVPVILHSLAIDLQPAAEFYNEIVESDAHRQRIAVNLANSLVPVDKHVMRQALRLLTLIDGDLGKRVYLALEALLKVSQKERQAKLAQCFASSN